MRDYYTGGHKLQRRARGQPAARQHTAWHDLAALASGYTHNQVAAAHQHHKHTGMQGSSDDAPREQERPARYLQQQHAMQDGWHTHDTHMRMHTRKEWSHTGTPHCQGASTPEAARRRSGKRARWHMHPHTRRGAPAEAHRRLRACMHACIGAAAGVRRGITSGLLAPPWQHKPCQSNADHAHNRHHHHHARPRPPTDAHTGMLLLGTRELSAAPIHARAYASLSAGRAAHERTHTADTAKLQPTQLHATAGTTHSRRCPGVGPRHGIQAHQHTHPAAP